MPLDPAIQDAVLRRAFKPALVLLVSNESGPRLVLSLWRENATARYGLEIEWEQGGRLEERSFDFRCRNMDDLPAQVARRLLAEVRWDGKGFTHDEGTWHPVDSHLVAMSLIPSWREGAKFLLACTRQERRALYYSPDLRLMGERTKALAQAFSAGHRRFSTADATFSLDDAPARRLAHLRRLLGSTGPRHLPRSEGERRSSTLRLAIGERLDGSRSRKGPSA